MDLLSYYIKDSLDARAADILQHARRHDGLLLTLDGFDEAAAQREAVLSWLYSICLDEQDQPQQVHQVMLTTRPAAIEARMKCFIQRLRAPVLKILPLKKAQLEDLANRLIDDTRKREHVIERMRNSQYF